MKKKIDENIITGYIEGFYGKLLDWNSRKILITSLYKNKMNSYFYAPKEDKNHRFHWRAKYSLKWRKHFKDFTQFSKKKNINIIAGIAPGLDFNFETLDNSSTNNQSCDFELLYNKAKQLLEDGADVIALLLDDIPNNFEIKFGNNVSEGRIHALLANKLSKRLKKNIYFVPRIYADELIEDAPNYLSDLSLFLNPNIIVFYCGENVVSKTLTNNSTINRFLPNKIVYWDNYYANDYCPRRFFIGPYTGRKKLNNFMINPTGSLNTDLLILDIVANTINSPKPHKDWLKILNDHRVPLTFNIIKKFFLKPDFGSKPSLPVHKVNSKHFEALEFLLWSWKGKLSREWYPYLFGLKHDLQVNKKVLTSERIIKTQTQPLAHHLEKK